MDTKIDPVLFCEKYLGIKLHWYQKLYLKLYCIFNNLKGEGYLLCKARNSSKFTSFWRIVK